MKRFDAIIIGTGQAGPSLASRFAGQEDSHHHERHKFGGTSMNTGCVLTETLGHPMIRGREKGQHTAKAHTTCIFDLRPDLTAILKAFEAGALIAMAAESMAPEAFHNGPAIPAFSPLRASQSSSW